MTTSEPGPSDVLTQGAAFRPSAAAFLATSPAPSMTEGLDVFVQDVIAAITTAPSSIFASSPLIVTVTAFDFSPASDFTAVSAEANSGFDWVSAMRSCGRFGPAMLGTTEAMSSLSDSL